MSEDKTQFIVGNLPVLLGLLCCVLAFSSQFKIKKVSADAKITETAASDIFDRHIMENEIAKALTITNTQDRTDQGNPIKAGVFIWQAAWREAMKAKCGGD